jgi:hypothetical protein
MLIVCKECTEEQKAMDRAVALHFANKPKKPFFGCMLKTAPAMRAIKSMAFWPNNRLNKFLVLALQVIFVNLFE